MKKIYPASDDLVESIIKKRNSLYDRYIDALSEFYHSAMGINKSKRYWEILTYRFFVPYVEYYLTCEHFQYKEDITKCRTIDYIPCNDSQFFQISHQYLLIPSKDFSVSSGYPPSQENKGDSVKIRVKNLIKSYKNRWQWGKEKLLVFSESLPGVWSLIFPELKVISVRIPSKPVLKTDTNLKLRKCFRDWMIEYGGFELAEANHLTALYPKDYLENYESLDKDTGYFKNIHNVKALLAGWLPHISTRMYIADCVERNVPFYMVQHGGAYGEYQHSLYDYAEKRISDKFFSWSQPTYDHSIVPVIPTRLVKFRVQYEKRRKSFNKTLEAKYKMLIVEGLRYRAPSFHDITGVNGYSSTLIDFLSRFESGDGDGVLVRLYIRKGLIDPEYQNELQGLFPKLTIHEQSVSIIDDMLMSEKLLVNYRYSTFRWEANYVGRRVEFLEDYLVRTQN